jgi:hypothetical protein
MSATKGQMNWASVAWNSVTMTRVNSVSIARGGGLLEYAGDTDIYDTIIVANAVKPTISVTTSDPAILLAMQPGVSSTFTATWKDVKGASGGDINFTISGAVFENTDAQGQHAQLGTATANWKVGTADGITDPIGIARS